MSQVNAILRRDDDNAMCLPFKACFRFELFPVRRKKNHIYGVSSSITRKHAEINGDGSRFFLSLLNFNFLKSEYTLILILF